MYTRVVNSRVLQDYFEALACGPQEESPYRVWHLIASYAELRYRLNGGARCPVCRAHVRHVVPVTVKLQNGTTQQYGCLCQRCLQAEQATAKSVVLRLGAASWEVVKRKARARVMRMQERAS